MAGVHHQSVTYWGNDLLSGAGDKDVGVGIVPVDTTADYIETFTISTESADDSVLMVLEWERTRVAVGVWRERR